MILGTKSKWLAILLLFIVANGANALPTMSEGDGQYSICAVSLRSHAHSIFWSELSKTTEPCSFYLAGITAEFMKPPSDFTYFPAAPVQVKLLPAIPTALLMVLTGFLCISLVKDRKAWWAVLAGLLWLGQAGFFAVPQLVWCLCGKKQTEQPSSLNVTDDIRQFKNISRCRIDYVSKRLLLSFHVIIPEQYNLNLAKRCLVSITKRHIFISPAFIFAQLPRGPPAPALKCVFLERT